MLNKTDFIHAQGQKIVDGNGQEILLRGVGLGSWLLPEGYMWCFPNEGDRPRRIEGMVEALLGKEKALDFWTSHFTNYIAEKDIEQIAKEGFNSLRLPINARFLMDEATFAYHENHFLIIDQFLDWCEKHNIYVILDLHGALGGQTGTNIDDSAHDQPDLFTNPLYQDMTVKLWRTLAERYNKRTIIAAYDLLNEPLPNWFSQYNEQILPLYERIITAIREVDPCHMITLQGVHWSTDWSIFSKDLPDDNLLLQFHKYWNNPDTESISQYLKAREEWNVPIFMGEGGENNKNWYTGAFRLFEDHNISWNFWTWKKMNTTNSPCSIKKPDGWDRLVRYLTHGEEVEPGLAEEILWTYLENMKFENCDYHSDVVRSLFRRPNVTIPAVFYGFKGEGISHCGKQPRTNTPAFRGGDAMEIRFLQEGSRKASFEHGQGQEWTDEEWLCLHLHGEEWVVYNFQADRDYGESELRISIHVSALEDNPELELHINDKVLDKRQITDSRWHDVDFVVPSPLKKGDHSIKLKSCGSLRVQYLSLTSDGHVQCF